MDKRITRSMVKNLKLNNEGFDKLFTPNPDPDPDPDPDEDEDVDDKGNIKGLIDYENDEKIDKNVKKELKLTLKSFKKKPKKSRKHLKCKKQKQQHQLPDMFMSYILMDTMNKCIMQTNSSPSNRILISRNKGKSEFIKENLIKEIIEDKISTPKVSKSESSDSLNSKDIIDQLEEESYNTADDELEGDLTDDSEGIIDEDDEDEDDEEDDDDDDDEACEYLGEEDSDSDSDVELSALDEEYLELIEEEMDNEGEEFEYFHKLPDDAKHLSIAQLKDISQINKTSIPLKFKILESKMDMKTKSIAINNVDKLNEMDTSSGEFCKMDKWINGLITIPFGEFSNLNINSDNSIDEKRDFIMNTKNTLDKAIFGHKEAKLHILQVIGQWITNPTSGGNVLALQGPMGNGKTTLVKEGIAKAIGRPFAFISLGGTSDSSFFDGHSYTYEGSHWGRIIDILMTNKCMNPIIYFDELDKVSETYKGQEIIHMLTHLTDQSQNALFQDNYFPGINIDLSKCLFIFSFNDESKVDRILKDRMYVINTKGFNTNDKIKICKEYLLPELMGTFMFSDKDIIFEDDIIENIITNFTNKEEGVRNLKRCVETIISKINIYNLSYDSEKENIDLTFKIKDFKLPLTINLDIVNTLLKTNNSVGPPSYMYM